MNVEQMNRMRRMAGLPDLTREKRINVEEKAEKANKRLLTEAANNRPSSKVLSDIAKQHLHVRSLTKTGDDDKDYHDCPCWAIEAALKAAYKAGQQSAKEKKKTVEESVADKESKEEAKKGGSKFDKKGGEKYPKDGKDKVEGKDNTKVEENKKADKDYDDDGKIESSEKEYKDSRDKAIKKAKKKDMKEMYYEDEEDYNSSYKKGQLVKHGKKMMIVHVPDAKADYIGVIPADMQDASEDEKDAAVDLVKKSECDPASDADYEDCEMAMGMSEGSSEGYNNPKGTKLKTDKDSGAHAKKGDAYKDKVHKDNSMKAKSEDKGKKGLKKISEADDATVWGKDYGHDDGRVDRNDDAVDKLKVADPNADDKISVPAKLKTSLQTQINALREEADKVHVRDYYGSEFYRNTADAFENLLGHLKEGTKRSIQLAQIDLNRVMSPMVERLPNEVYMFIVRGGKPAALTELFKEVKVKREKGADLSKEDYTK